MASNINEANIDGTYPVAGQDNDTQGFRDNFTIIKTALGVARTEIGTLQETAAQGAEYDASTSTNNFNGTKIRDAIIDQGTESYSTVAGVVTSQEVSFNNGMYQSIRFGEDAVNTTVSLLLTGFPTPSSRVARFRVELFGAGVSDTVTVSFDVAGGGVLKKSPSWPIALVVDSADDPIIMEFWSYDGGQTVYGEYKGRFEP